ncbi:MAG: sulfite reductase subunit C [Erysipelotrichaceae bacterium]|nr:sulfite reductase subunit C [Erysipelotrichaceae bacterium]
MNQDINVKKVRMNCFRQSKVPGEFMLQLRLPGNLMDADLLDVVKHVAKTWGDGLFHIGTRQTLNAMGIKYQDIPAVNEYISEYIQKIQAQSNTDMNRIGLEKVEWDPKSGYPTIGARNIMACIGNRHCIKANIDTTDIARKIEPLIFPSHYHIKIAVAGCPNDCAKANFNDFGIMGVSKMTYHPERCIGCGACAKACGHHATRVLSLNAHGKIDKDTCCCVGCGECVIACPTGAWTRAEDKFFRVTLGGRTGKKDPRAGKLFLNWIKEEPLLQMFGNWTKFSAWVMDNKPQYLHGGHLIDMAGYHKFKEMILEGVELNPECLVAEQIYWAESEQRGNSHLIPLKDHPHAGPRD